ncbi:Phage terminase, large subunit GpA [Bradyrhizobium sp. Ghvi]|uniref:terminase gpA endonuclease subunit n=1 Tax=Bradyrhizobium sp. Ghvi TaxID=1855319 RepID=UPI0008E963D1|nr:terminase gpA endonuclease subunit [Bradyrhizobium sp. Ghvi]SFO17902.1 Phage terminase, large subunit GpA [Bradyrhizobium sp. Ghvi]
MPHDIAREWLRAWSPPQIVKPSTFAEAEIYLPASANAQPGPLRLTSYQREIVDSIADPEVEFIILQLASQVGKSASVNAMLSWIVDCNPAPVLHVSPTNDRAEEFVRERWQPLVDGSPALRDLIGRGQHTRKGSGGGANSLSLQSFPGGQIAFVSSHRPDQLAARAVKYVFADEVDRFAISAGTEGDPLALAVKRTKTYEGRGRKLIFVSTPTSRSSRINAWYERGDKRRFHVTCRECNHAAPLEFESLRWDAGVPSTAYHACAACGAVQDEHTRRQMIREGFWKPTAKGEPGIRSYHLDELSSLFSTMASVVQSFEEATTPEAKTAWYNTTLARMYEANVEFNVNPDDLRAQAVSVKPPYAADITHVTMGCDVQTDRVELTYLAAHADETYTVLNHLRLPGSTSDLEVWQKLDAAAGATFQLIDGRTLPVSVQAVDAGFNTDKVAEYVRSQQRKSRSAFALVGRGGFERALIAKGNRLRGSGLPVMIVGSDTAKLIVGQSLVSGQIRVPDHLDLDYYEGLASEELRSKQVGGAIRKYFERVVRRNEPLDGLCYALAASRVVSQRQAAVRSQAQPTKPTQTFADSIKKLAALSGANQQ